jgi:hypothetical protein
VSHPTVESHLSDCLDVCSLRRMGLLDGGVCRIAAGIRWPKLESITIDPTCVSVIHRSGQEQTFAISWAQEFPTTKRPWLVCIHCGQRYARLFRGFGGYSCRECLQLRYRCQTVSTRRRMKSRLVQLCLRVDDKPARYSESTPITFPKRQKGMHRRRYYRLRGRAADIETKLKDCSAIAGWMSALPSDEVI